METIYTRFTQVASKNYRRPSVYWKENKQWHSYTYGELLNKVDTLADNLINLGIKKDDHVAILCENRPEWLLYDLAINKLGAVSIPIHITANHRMVEFILKHSESNFLFISESCYRKHITFLTQFNLVKIIVIGVKAGSNSTGLTIPFKELLKKAEETFHLPPADVSENDLASIIYTSGTTGEPKGVMLTNKNFLANIDSICKTIDIYSDDKFLSFLPISHIFERTAGSYTPILSGASIAYAESIKTLAGNIKEAKPTILICVPKIFEVFQEKIIEGIERKHPIIRKYFYMYLENKEDTLTRWLVDKMIYKKIRHIFGGRLRLAASGGASIHERILLFFNGIGICLIEGYGMTETSPVISVNLPEYAKIGSVGKPIKDVLVRIASDNEICVKGENVTSGYWKNDEATHALFDEEGWLKTGDLGQMDSDNFLTIIGRKKELIVTTSGKNIAPTAIENLLNMSPFIFQSFVAGHGKDYIVALIVPDEETIKNHFDEEKVDVYTLIKKEIGKVNSELMIHEKIVKFYILQQPFTIEADELTPTLKVRRNIIEEKYKKEIDSMY